MLSVRQGQTQLREEIDDVHDEDNDDAFSLFST